MLQVGFVHRLSLGCSSLLLIAGCLDWASSLYAQASGTANGNQAFYSSSTTLNGSGTYIDASKFPGSDLCVKINNALFNIPANVGGAVIDARGINAGGTNSCAASPWSSPHDILGGSTTAENGAVILLPSGVIQISATWIFQNGSKVVGEGAGLTTIQATSSLSGPMLQMAGLSSGTYNHGCPPCSGVGIEELTLNGENVSTVTTGILNGVYTNGTSPCNAATCAGAEEHSYVRDVVITNVPGIGLEVTGELAVNSGPYENLLIEAGTGNTSTSNECMAIGGLDTAPPTGGLRAFRGINCIGNGVAPIGIDLNSDNTTLESITISGFTNGLVVGDLANIQNNVQGDVLINIAAATASGTMTNLIELSNAGNCTASNQSKCNSPNCQPPHSICLVTNMSDVVIFGVTNTVATNTIKDQLTGTSGTTITKTQAQYVGMYVLGQPLFAANSLTQNSRFTTVATSAVPSWLTGSFAIPNGTSCSLPGSLYSNTGGTIHNSNTLYVCGSTSSGNTWIGIGK